MVPEADNQFLSANCSSSKKSFSQVLGTGSGVFGNDPQATVAVTSYPAGKATHGTKFPWVLKSHLKASLVYLMVTLD